MLFPPDLPARQARRLVPPRLIGGAMARSAPRLRIEVDKPSGRGITLHLACGVVAALGLWLLVSRSAWSGAILIALAAVVWFTAYHLFGVGATTARLEVDASFLTVASGSMLRVWPTAGAIETLGASGRVEWGPVGTAHHGVFAPWLDEGSAHEILRAIEAFAAQHPPVQDVGYVAGTYPFVMPSRHWWVRA